MPVEITNWALSSYHAFNRSLGFMAWNTFLAIIPWAISLWIFRGRGSGARSVGWWIGFATFMAFLPNAPYVLTDIIHLVRYIRQGASMWTIVFVWMPQYFLFMLIGTEAYVLSLINMGEYLRKQGYTRWIGRLEIAVHALCVFGIYLGRVPRFNSWDLLTHPMSIANFIIHDMFQPQALAMMAVAFCAIAFIYWPLKHLTLATILYWQSPEYRRTLKKIRPSHSLTN
ncbi:MAG: DUF1361 domain-containing protein [Phormidesmis sp.]